MASGSAAENVNEENPIVLPADEEESDFRNFKVDESRCSSAGIELIEQIRVILSSIAGHTSTDAQETSIRKRQIEDALEELELRVASISELKEKICQQHIDSQNILQNNKTLEKRYALLKNDLDLYKKSEVWYKQQLYKCQNSKAEALKDNFYLKKSMVDVERRLERVSNERDKAKREYEHMRIKLKQTHDKLQMRVSELEILRRFPPTESERSSDDITQQYYESVIQEMGGEILKMKAVVEEQQEVFSKYNKENAELLSRVTVMQKTLTEKECLIEQLQMQCGELNNKFVLTTDLLNDLKRFNSNLITEKDEAEIKLVAVNEEKQFIQRTLNEIRRNFNKVIESQNKLKSELREKEKIISDYQCEKQQDFMDKNWKICTAEELKHNSTEIGRLHREIENLVNREAALKEENIEFARQHSNSLVKISKLESTIDYLQQMLLESENKYKNYVRERTSAEENTAGRNNKEEKDIITEFNEKIASLQEECEKRQLESERLQNEIIELERKHALDVNEILECVTNAFLEIQSNRVLPIQFPDNCYRVKSCENVLKNLESLINKVFSEVNEKNSLMESQRDKYKKESEILQERIRFITERVSHLCAKSNRINRKVAITYMLLKDVYLIRPVELLVLIEEYEQLKLSQFENDESDTIVYRYDYGSHRDRNELDPHTIRPLNGTLVEKSPKTDFAEMNRLTRTLKKSEEQNRYLTNEIKLLTSAYNQKSKEADESRNKTIQLKTNLEKTDKKLQTVMDTLHKDMRILENDLNSVKNEKYFLQRLCNDLKLALRSSTSQCQILNERLAERSPQLMNVPNSLPDVPSRYDEGHVKRLLEESVSVPVIKSVGEVQENLDALKREFAILQQQISEKCLCCL